MRLIFLSLILFPKSFFAQSNNTIIAGEKHTIYSKIIGEDKEYWVHLPVNYDKSDNHYPVLYITDGDEHFSLASGATEFMSSQYMIPEMIVVSIFHKDRNHDLTPTHITVNNEGFRSDALKVSGGGEKLLQFIEKELIVEIERNYRTGPYRILAGHSLGGLFSMYAYLNRNALFNAFISMDPALTWDNHLCERMLKTASYQSASLSSKLYISSAHNAPYGEPDTSPFRRSQDAFDQALKSKQIENVRHDYFEDRNHLAVPYNSLYAALTYIFSGYYILDDPQFVLEISFIQKFYEEQSELYDISFTPAEGLIEMLGKYFLFDINEYGKAIEFFTFNTMNYPTSYRAFEYLAKAHRSAGHKEEAIANFRKALALSPGNKDIQKMLTELEKQ